MKFPNNSIFSITTLSAALVATAACLSVTTGCAKSGDESATTTGSSATSAPAGEGAGKKVKLAFVTNNVSDFWTIAESGTKQAQKEMPNIDVQFKKPDDGTAATQKRIVDDLLAGGIDGFAISPKDPANETQMLNDAAKKAVVFTQDSDAPQSDRVCYIGTDNVAAGKMAGDLIKEALPNGGKIILFVGSIDAQNAKERKQGIEESLKGSKVQILDTRTDDADHAKAKSNAADMLVKTPDLAALVGLWSYNGPAILSAVKDANKVGKVKIICFDEEQETLAGVKSGAIYGTVVQQPFEFGHQSMIMMAKYIGGDKSVIPASKKVIIPTKAIKQNNVDEFKAKLDEQLGKAPAK